MLTEQDIIDLVERYAKAKGCEVTTAARELTGSGDAVDRWNAGGGLTLRRARLIIERAAALWPKGAEWPRRIERPRSVTRPHTTKKRSAA